MICVSPLDYDSHSNAYSHFISNSYTMGCPPVRGDNPQALDSGLYYVQIDNHGITLLYHLHQCKSRGILC